MPEKTSQFALVQLSQHRTSINHKHAQGFKWGNNTWWKANVWWTQTQQPSSHHQVSASHTALKLCCLQYLSISVIITPQRALRSVRTGLLHNFNAQSPLKTPRSTILYLLMTQKEIRIAGLEASNCPSAGDRSLHWGKGGQAKPKIGQMLWMY